MPADPSFTLADLLFRIVDCFCKSMARDGRTRLLGSLSVAVWNRARGFEQRFRALYSMWKAGTLPKVGGAGAVAHPSPRPSPTRGEGETARAFDPMACDAASLDRARLRPTSVLPRALGWLHRLLPTSAPPFTGDVQSLLLNYPETREFVADCPQAGRILRPLCKMVGLKPPEWLKLPRRVVSGAYPSPRPPGSSPGASLCSPTGGEGEGKRGRRTAREIAEALIAWSERTGKPIDFRKVAPVVLGYLLHTPRDGNCPPPEIGYGGRRWRPPKDYKPPRDWE